MRSDHVVKFWNKGIEILLPWAKFVVKKSLEEKHISIGDCDLVESLKDEVKYLRAENQIKPAIIKTLSEKEKSLPQCSHSVIAPILESSKRNPKCNSPNKSTCSELLNNVVKVRKENTCDKSPTIHSDKNRQKRIYKCCCINWKFQ